MADIDDPEGLRKRLQRQLRLLRKAAEMTEGDEDESSKVTPILEDDKEAIMQFLILSAKNILTLGALYRYVLSGERLY